MTSTNDRHFVVHVFGILSQYAVFLFLGTAAALVWANLDVEGYRHFIEVALFHSALLGEGAEHTINLRFLVNDVFMVFFFGMAVKEVAESILPGGALSSPRRAAMPALATAGGVLGPVCVFFILHKLLAPEPAFSGGWAIPTATDIAYCWIAARILFGRAHPAVSFLLVLAVLDDLIGMAIIAVFYTPELHLVWLGLVGAGMVCCETMRRSGIKSFWPYLLVGGPLCWFGLHEAGVHTALALVPVVPFMPHAERDAGLFVDVTEEVNGKVIKEPDTLSRFEHYLGPVVDVGLFGFGFANAGVVLSFNAFVGKATWIILLSLLVGKTLGIFSFSWIGRRCGLELPKGVDLKQTLALGMIAGIGFTVALFVTAVFLDQMDGAAVTVIADQLKLGALLSFSAMPIGFVLAKVLHVRRML